MNLLQNSNILLNISLTNAVNSWFNLGWATTSVVFTATAPTTQIEFAAQLPGAYGVMLDAINLQLVGGVTNSLPANLYYQPEQDISGLVGERAYGTMASGNPWQLEILDNRAGATGTNTPVLLGWQLEFTFANTNLVSSTVTVSNATGGIPQTNTLAAGAIDWYAYTVPTNASYATNIIDFATAPVNLWFSTNNPPTTTGSGDVKLLAGSTNGSALLGLFGSLVNTNPPAYIVTNQTYYLGVQNPNDIIPITYRVEVDFDHGNDSNSIYGSAVGFSKVKASSSSVQLSWSAAAGAQYQVQWKTNLAAAWNTVTNPATATTNGVATFTDNGAQTAPLGPMRFYRLVRTH